MILSILVLDKQSVSWWLKYNDTSKIQVYVLHYQSFARFYSHCQSPLQRQPRCTGSIQMNLNVALLFNLFYTQPILLVLMTGFAG